MSYQLDGQFKSLTTNTFWRGVASFCFHHQNVRLNMLAPVSYPGMMISNLKVRSLSISTLPHLPCPAGCSHSNPPEIRQVQPAKFHVVVEHID